MSRYTLEVVSSAIEEELADALEAIATVHGGAVVEPFHASGRQYVNIFDCESSLEEEVAWLRSRFPLTRFRLKELM